jgi:Protein of unknown function (DUF3800)
LFKVYLDESGVHDASPVVAVAGYLARPNDWKVFERRWTTAIKPIKVYHAADAANCRGEFKDWSKQDVAKLAERALPLIPKHTLMAVAAAINLEDFAAALSGRSHLEPLLGSPYGACLQWVLAEILENKRLHHNREAITFIHETNALQEEARRTFRYVAAKWGQGERIQFMFGTKARNIPLQAADIYAYEANKRIRDASRPSRRALDALVPNPARARLKYFDKSNVGWMIERLARYAELNSDALADGLKHE